MLDAGFDVKEDLVALNESRHSALPGLVDVLSFLGIRNTNPHHADTDEDESADEFWLPRKKKGR